MGRPLRFMPAKMTTFEITSRCIHGRLLLRPSAELNQIILGIIGVALTRYPVLLHLVTVASNHVHLIISVGDCKAMADFMCFFKSKLAREAGRIYGWREKLWGRRYRAIPILDAEKQHERARYLLSHGCKEGLVARPADWPGVNCVAALLEGRALTGVWYNRTKEYEARKAGEDCSPEDFATVHEVTLTPLPMLAGKSEEEQRAWYRQTVDEIENETKARLDLLRSLPIPFRSFRSGGTSSGGWWSRRTAIRSTSSAVRPRSVIAPQGRSGLISGTAIAGSLRSIEWLPGDSGGETGR